MKALLTTAILLQVFLGIGISSAETPQVGKYVCKSKVSQKRPTYVLNVANDALGFKISGKPLARHAEYLQDYLRYFNVKIKARYLTDTGLVVGDYRFRHSSGAKGKNDLTGTYDSATGVFSLTVSDGHGPPPLLKLFCELDAAQCNIQGTWTHVTGELAPATWTFTKNEDGTYAAEEIGLGNATGTATLTGHVLHIDWITADRAVTGTYDWTLEENCREGAGYEHDSLGNTRQSLITKN